MKQQTTMSSAGHVLDMIKRIKSNRDLRMRNREKNHERLSQLQSRPTKTEFNAEKFPKKSAAENEKIRKHIRAQNRKDNIVALLCTIIATIILVVLLVAFVKNV